MKTAGFAQCSDFLCLAFLQASQREIVLYHQYAEWYGYVFMEGKGGLDG